MPNRLSRLRDQLDPNTYEALSRCSNSVEGFLLDHYHEIGKPHLQGQQGPLPHGACEAMESLIMRGLVAPQPKSGIQLYRQAIDLVRVLPTGCDSLDALLGGGLREAQMTELAGESASGKTQILMQVAALTALRGEGVVWVDTTNSFAPERVAVMAASMAAGSAGEDVAQQGRNALKGISVCRAHSIYDVLHLLDKVALALKNGTSGAAGSREEGGILPEAGRKVSLLIIDSVSAVISPVLGGQQHSQGHVLMLSLSRMIKQLAEKHCLAAVVSNHIVSGGATGGGTGVGTDSGSGARPALGEHWRPQPSWRLFLSSCQPQRDTSAVGVNVKRAERVTSPLHAAGSCAFFTITVEGVIEAPLMSGNLRLT